MGKPEQTTGIVTTSDGVDLHYIESGSGPPLVLLHGWSQSAELFRHQIESLQSGRRVIALDMRGHGKSQKPAYGYRISRLAQDLHEVLTALDLSDVALLGHSMGCSVIWCYWDLFGAERLAGLVFVDQQAFMLRNPAWSDLEVQAAGGTLGGDALFDLINALAGPEGDAVRAKFIAARFTHGADRALIDWVTSENRHLPRVHAATLMLHHATQDWRDVIARITLPTLVITGRAGKPLPSQEWIRDQIPGACLEMFEVEEGGEHFMFLENPDKFNRIVAEFIATIPARH